MHKHGACEKIKEQTNDVEESAVWASDAEKSQETGAGASNALLVLLRNWPLMSAVIAYCVFQLHDMAYIEVR